MCEMMGRGKETVREVCVYGGGGGGGRRRGLCARWLAGRGEGKNICTGVVN